MEYVRAIESSGYGYKADGIYKVKSIDSTTIYTEMDEKDNTSNGWNHSKFIEATEEEYNQYHGITPKEINFPIFN